MRHRRRKNPAASTIVIGVGAVALAGLGYYLYTRGVFSSAPASRLMLHAAGGAITPAGMTNAEGKKITDAFGIKDAYTPGIPDGAKPPFDPYAGVPVGGGQAATAILSGPALSWRQALARSSDFIGPPAPDGGGIGTAPPRL